MKDQQQPQRIVNANISQHIPEHAWDSTVAIVIAHDNTVYQFGSGILFRVAEESFLVTAAHVIKYACKRGKTLGISSATGFFVAVPGQWICSSEGQYGTDKDPFDVAVQKLPEEVVDKIGDKTFLRCDDIEFDSRSPTAAYALFGFPGIWSKPSASASDALQLKPFQYATFAYDGNTDALAEYQDRFHLLLDAQPQYISIEDGSPAQFQDLAGNGAPFPRGLGGISGCSVWRIGDLNVPFDDWRRERHGL